MPVYDSHASPALGAEAAKGAAPSKKPAAAAGAQVSISLFFKPKPSAPADPNGKSMFAVTASIIAHLKSAKLDLMNLWTTVYPISFGSF